MIPHWRRGKVVAIDSDGSVFRRVLQYRPALVGLVLLAVLILVTLFAPLIATHDPMRVSPDIKVPPSSEHWFGTDLLGRDIFSGVVHGGRVSLLVGLITGLVVLLVGIVVGCVAGYFGGAVDSVLMRISEVFQVIPSFVLALVAVATFGQGLGLISIAIAVAIWPQVARIVRAQFLSIKSLDMTASARVVGYGHARIIASEILPNALPPVVVQVTLDIGTAILIEAGLSFLGLGDPTTISWGGMLQNAQGDLRAWWMAVPPGLAIMLTVLSINFVGDGINHAYNPARKEYI